MIENERVTLRVAGACIKSSSSRNSFLSFPLPLGEGQGEGLRRSRPTDPLPQWGRDQTNKLRRQAPTLTLPQRGGSRAKQSMDSEIGWVVTRLFVQGMLPALQAHPVFLVGELAGFEVGVRSFPHIDSLVDVFEAF